MKYQIKHINCCFAHRELSTATQDAHHTIPPKANRVYQRKCDWWLYKERHLVECFFNKLKHFRRVATRYDKLAKSFFAFVLLACIVILVK